MAPLKWKPQLLVIPMHFFYIAVQSNSNFDLETAVVG